MTKRASGFGLVLPPRQAETSAYRWLYASLRAEILEGRLRSGARLPATRDLARQYRLSRGTIVSAFELLKSEGYLRGTIGSGTYVSKILPEALLQVTRAPGARSSPQRKKKSSVSDYGRRVKLFSGFEMRAQPRFPLECSGARFISYDFMGADHGAAIAARFDATSAGLRCDGIRAAAGSGGQLPEHVRAA